MIKTLTGSKSSLLKKSISTYYEKLTGIFNNCVRSGTFPEILKKAEVKGVFKKGDPTSKTDYCRVSTLSNFSKSFEKPIYLQYSTGFRKNRRTQYALFRMIETWGTELSMGHSWGVVYMDLSTAFDSLNHELLIAKLKCYGLDQHAVKFFRS